MNFIFRSTGQYLGFIVNGYLFSRDGEYLGWVEGNFVWDKSGQYRGSFTNDGKYIVRNIYTVLPVPRAPRPYPITPSLPAPQANIAPIVLPIGLVDAF